MEMELSQVLEGCKHNDQQAQGCLYERFAPMLMGICYRYTHSHEDSRDLLHDAFIKIFTGIRTVRNEESLQSWMCRVMVATTIDFLRKRSGKDMVSDEVLKDDEGGNARYESPVDTDPYELSDIFDALEQLPDRYRIIFNMHEVDEMEYDDISAFTGLSEVAVRVTLFRARTMLRSLLEEKSNTLPRTP